MYANELHWPVALDLLGIFTASCAGALTGIRKGLDLVGVLVLAAVTGLGGGVIRDLMIGASPPALLTDWRYLSTATVAGIAVLALEHGTAPATVRAAGRWGRRARNGPPGAASEPDPDSGSVSASVPASDPMSGPAWRTGPGSVAASGFRLRDRMRLGPAYLLADAATLGCFAVSGTAKALQFHIDPVPAALMGVTTAVGGGVIRDILVNEVPTVLRRELYALPALIGALIIVAAAEISRDLTPVAYAAAAVTAGLRLLALRFDWHLQLPETRVRPDPPQ
ncbi:MAG TPA: TRIC cation channel family protein [Actinocrinis sp.]|nr:TRIC cation channel family protein [Actinocrinis sp.]